MKNAHNNSSVESSCGADELSVIAATKMFFERIFPNIMHENPTQQQKYRDKVDVCINMNTIIM